MAERYEADHKVQTFSRHRNAAWPLEWELWHRLEQPNYAAGKGSLKCQNPRAEQRKSELVFSPSIQSTTKSTSFFGNNSIDSKSTLNLQNWGFIFSSKLGKDDELPEWKYINFGFGMNRYSVLSSRTYIAGTNELSSIGDYFVQNANGTSKDNLSGVQSLLPYNAYFIDPDTNKAGNYISQSKGNEPKFQNKIINSNGFIGETVVSLAGNYANKWYFGATLGIAKINYSEKSTFEETDSLNKSGNFKRFTFTDNFLSKGTGFNLKLGVIYKPADWIRMGVAIHTTYTFNLVDVTSATMTTTFDTTEFKTASADNSGGYSYKIKTPMRLIGSLGFIIGKYGLITIDNEIIDYRQMNLYPANTFSITNQIINSKYVATNNLKLGAEINMKPFALRIGYALLANSFGKNYNSINQTTNYSFGLGYRNSNFFIDFAFITSQTKADRYYLYDYYSLPSAKITTHKNIGVVSVGLKW
jgi:hypothetical protein